MGDFRKKKEKTRDVLSKRERCNIWSFAWNLIKNMG